jgi:hypothetical protein
VSRPPSYDPDLTADAVGLITTAADLLGLDLRAPGQVVGLQWRHGTEVVETDTGEHRYEVDSVIVALACGCVHLVESHGGGHSTTCTVVCREHRPPSYGPCLPQPTDTEVDSIPF